MRTLTIRIWDVGTKKAGQLVADTETGPGRWTTFDGTPKALAGLADALVRFSPPTSLGLYYRRVAKSLRQAIKEQTGTAPVLVARLYSTGGEVRVDLGNTGENWPHCSGHQEGFPWLTFSRQTWTKAEAFARDQGATEIIRQEDERCYREWIDGANYETLVRRWRFGGAGDPILAGDIGKYYIERLRKSRRSVGEAAHFEVSRRVGFNWGPCRARQLEGLVRKERREVDPNKGGRCDGR